MGEMLRCETSFFTSGRMFSLGEHFDADDPIVQKNMVFFEKPRVRTTATVPGKVTAPPPAPVDEAEAEAAAAAPPPKKATKRAVPRPNKGDDD